jgi:hypothetical protein
MWDSEVQVEGDHNVGIYERPGDEEACPLLGQI